MSQPARYPTFSDAEFARRLAAVRAKMDKHDLDALLLYGAGRAPDIQYLTNWPGTRESFLVVPRQGDPTLLVQLYNHVPNARRVALTSDVRWAGSSPPETLASVLETVPLHDGIVGLVGAWLSRVVDGLKVLLAQVGFVDASPILRDLRTVKSAEELERLRIAARLTDAAMRALEREVSPGMREYELAAIVEGAYLREGGVNAIHFMATTSMRAPQIGVPSQIPSSRIIEPGDILISEIGAEWWGYAGQIHRAYAIGADPTDVYIELHDVAVEAYRRIVDALHDGATVADVLDAAEVIHERGFTIYDDLLHGTGQLPPIIQTRRTRRGDWTEDFVFREDMVVVVQPNVVTDDSGRIGLQVGETVRITKAGVERLHDYPMRFVRIG
ncbi:MAG TPA: Xaa-Pro peptidase family protein [Candidatus Limnocylindria bacterium]|nr:Xaa-Pro peptidase family protein [Candidatus Limnocylindria bacterium]